MAWLFRFSLRHPCIAILLGFAVVLAAAPGLARLELRTDGHALVPTRAPEILRDQRIRAEFGIRDPVIILIRADHPDGIFNVHTLTLVVELTEAMQSLEGVSEEDVSSLATEYGDRVWPGTLDFRRLLEPLPRTTAELARLRTDLREIGLYLGTVVSRHKQAAAIFVGVPPESDRTAFYNRVRAVIHARGAVPEQVDVIGAPVAEALLGTHILEDLGVPTALLGASTYENGAAPSALPTSVYELRVWLGRTVGLVPIAVAVMVLVFIVGFRGISAAALPMMEVGACLTFVFGLMGWFGVPVYLTIAVLPIILTAMGVADEVHIFSHYYKLLRAEPAAHANAAGGHGHVGTVHRAMEEMWRPITKTSITTAIGFLSFALSPIAAVRMFGVFTSIGILFCLLWSLTVVPGMLAVIPPRRITAPLSEEGGTTGAASPALLWLARTVTRYRVPVIIAALIVAAACPFGIRRVVVQDSWIDGFAPESGFFKATRYFNDHFLGMHQLLVVVDAGPTPVLEGQLAGRNMPSREIRLPGDLVADPKSLISQQIELKSLEPTELIRPGQPPKEIYRTWASRIQTARRQGDSIVVTGLPQRGLPRLALRLDATDKAAFVIKLEPLKLPEHMHRIRELESFIEGHEAEAVGGVLGPASYLETTSFMSKARKEEERRIPDDPERIEWLWNQYERIRGKERREELLDDEFTRGVVTAFMKDANFVDTGRLMREIREYEAKHLAPHGMSLEFAGDVAVSQTLIQAIVDTQVRSLVGSLIGIFLVTAVLGRSLLWGLLCLLPCALALLVNFAVMGWWSIPLGVATSMFAGMTLGVGVDFAIHLLERFRAARERGMDSGSAVVNAVTVAGPAIVIDALAVALGFGVLILSQVPANNRLGILLALSIVNCLIATMVVLPALLRLTGKTLRGPAL